MESFSFMITSFLFVSAVLFTAPASGEATIPLDGFDDGFAHWQKKFGRDNTLEAYGPSEYRGIADNLVVWQNADGGWPKDVDWRVKLTKAEMNALMGVEGDRRSTFDNHNTVPQIRYLAEAFLRSNDSRYAKAVLQGLEYTLREQRPTGGWRGDDVDAITFNDDTMVGIMALLQDVNRDRVQFGWLSDDIRGRAAEALDRAIRCTLNCQIVIRGVKTAWCQQHDHETFAPVKARSYELPSITGRESVGAVQFLMSIESPTPEVVEAIDAAVAWLRAAAIRGIRLETRAIDPVRFENHTATHDTVVVRDPSAPPLWARYYDLETGAPFFCNRDGVVVHSLAEVALERRTGYAWYGDWPAQLLAEDYPGWKATRDIEH